MTLLGRSVQTQVRVAMNAGLLTWSSDLLTTHNVVASIDRHRSLVIAGGTQAEPMGALWKLSARSHPQLTLSADDLVVLSSRTIPGREPFVMRMISNFLRQGVQVHSRLTHPEVHVSGHGHREDQRRMANTVRPKCLLPVHGTHHHLKRHAEFARKWGIPHSFVAENGDLLHLDNDGLRKIGTVTTGRVAMYRGSDVADMVLYQRGLLARKGVVMLTLIADEHGNAVQDPVISTRGVIDDEQADSDRVRTLLQNIAETLRNPGYYQYRPTDQQVIDTAQRVVQRSFESLSGRRPECIVHLVRS